jgi:hypothetical protein
MGSPEVLARLSRWVISFHSLHFLAGHVYLIQLLVGCVLEMQKLRGSDSYAQDWLS